jgi:hypothetical protein
MRRDRFPSSCKGYPAKAGLSTARLRAKTMGDFAPLFNRARTENRSLITPS